MQELKFSVVPDGMICDVLIGLNGQTTKALVSARQAISRPVQCRGLIDTGSDVTCVGSPVLRRLGLITPIAKTTTTTTSGTVPVDLFEVSLNVLNLAATQGPMLVLTDLLVMELPGLVPKLDVLIGMDVLLTTRLLLDGPKKEFSLEF
jgi:hypothetical protein